MTKNQIIGELNRLTAEINELRRTVNELDQRTKTMVRLGPSKFESPYRLDDDILQHVKEQMKR